MTYLEVAVAAPIHHTLTYLPPDHATAQLTPGIRLLVPLGGRLVTGYLLGEQLAAENEAHGKKLRSVGDILDDDPLFPSECIALFRWLAEYYHFPIGQVIQSALPGGLNIQSGRRLLLTAIGRQAIGELSASADKQMRHWVSLLLKKGFFSPAETRKFAGPGTRHIFNHWLQQEWVENTQTISSPRVKPKTAVFIRPVHTGGKTSADRVAGNGLKPSEEKTLDLIRDLIAGEAEHMATGIARRDLIALFAGAGKALKGLEAKGLVTVEEKTLYRNPFGEELLAAAEPIALTAEQQVALDIVLPYLRRKKFTPFLLHGVTGSGKTEIYLRAAAATLQESRSVLVLVPEIALATQLESCFLSRFGDQVALLHSGLSPGEFYDQWQRILQGKARVVIGARSAVFAPLADPGLIVVDEEHDSSYKQDDGFRYHARDIAVLRASQSGSVVLLGSATPSISSKFHAETGKYRLLTLNKRINERPLPAVEIVDLRAIKTVSGRPPLFSNQLVKALKNNLRDGKQSLIFLNRRGYASMVLCNDCGNSVQCIHCRVSLTLHQASSRLLCHYCGYSVPRAVICPDCGSSHVVEVGFGTERIEQELAQIVPTARLARLDRDTCLKRHDYIRVLKGMHEHRVDILIGTQMIAKGHHFPLVTLVGIIWADVGLSVPDFRAAERTYQLLSQVTGRAGRGADPGRVIIQTHQPDHYGISLARQHDYEALYQREIALRRQLGYPPFARLINFRIEGSKERQVEKIAAALASSAEQLIKKGRATVKILGPAPAPLALLRGKFRWQLLLMGSERKVLHDCSISLLRQTANLATAQRVKVSLDIDPENLL